MNRILLLGTSHVSSESGRAVEKAIPHADVVAIELDAGRAQAILTGERASFKDLRKALGIRTAVLATVLRTIQEKIAKSLGVSPGLEMKAALETAQKSNKIIALIDRDVRITLKRLSASLGWRELKTFGRDMFRKRTISTHPSDEVVLQLLEEMRRSYPRVYTAMVSERDTYMVTQVRALLNAYPEKTILVVVGKGHVPGMIAQFTEHAVPFTHLTDDAAIFK